MSFTCIDVANAAGLDQGRQAGAERLFRCPKHDDQRPSLSINPAKDAWMCGPCNASGTAWKLAAFLGGADPADKTEVLRILNTWGLTVNGSNGNSSNGESRRRRIIATYPYVDESGALLYESVRYGPKKEFSQRRPDDAGGWAWNIDGVRRVPYHLPEVLRSVDVFIVEGEKDVDALRAIGLTATCNSGGAGKWTAEHSAYLKAHQHVAIIPDNDDAGRRHVQTAAPTLSGKVASLKVVELPGLPDRGDVSDWLVGKDPDAAAEELARMVEAAPEWTAEAVEEEEKAHVWELFDLGDVENWEAEPLVWKVENLIPVGGIGFKSGAPKDGKSLLTADMVLHIAHNLPWLDRFATSPSNILYIAREDPARRLKERLTEINRSYGYGPIPRGRVHFLIRERLQLTEARHIDWLYEQVRGKEFDFIVLDVLNRMIPELDEMSAKDMAKMVSILEQLNRELNLTIECLDHTRKPMNGKGSGRDEQTPNPFDLKGSIAKYGAADFMLCLSRTRDNGRLQLYAENKDTDERPHFLIDVSPKGSDKPKFRFAGDVEKLGNDMKVTGDKNREKVLQALTPTWSSSGDIAKKLTMSPETVRKHLNGLLAEKKVEKEGSTKTTVWRVFAETVNSESDTYEASHD